MKLEADVFDVQTIHSYGAGWVKIAGDKPETITHSLVISAKGERHDWKCRQFEDLTPAHFAQLASFGTELVIFGSGKKLRFPQTAWLQPLMSKRIGLETMDSGAACRTYNILAGEGRNVLLALVLEQESNLG